MELTARDIMMLLQEYANSPEGKKQIEENGYGSDARVDSDTLKLMADDLRRRLNRAFMSVNRTHDPITENINDIKISTRVTGRRGVVCTIMFPPLAIGRWSLEVGGRNGKKVAYTGEKYHNAHAAEFEGLDERYGVYDIVGLFTNGYTIRSAVLPKGNWVQANMGEYWGEANTHGRWVKTQALRHREPNDFVKVTIDRFIADYRGTFPNLQVEYPKEWGGTK